MAVDKQVREALRATFKRLKEKGYLKPADEKKLDSADANVRMSVLYGTTVLLRDDTHVGLLPTLSRKQLVDRFGG